MSGIRSGRESGMKRLRKSGIGSGRRFMKMSVGSERRVESQRRGSGRRAESGRSSRDLGRRRKTWISARKELNHLDGMFYQMIPLHYCGGMSKKC